MLLLGWIVSTVLAGAFVGSFTGGALADQFGRTKTFILDAIPLAVGAFLWYVPYHSQRYNVSSLPLMQSSNMMSKLSVPLHRVFRL